MKTHLEIAEFMLSKFSTFETLASVAHFADIAIFHGGKIEPGTVLEHGIPFLPTDPFDFLGHGGGAADGQDANCVELAEAVRVSDQARH